VLGIAVFFAQCFEFLDLPGVTKCQASLPGNAQAGAGVGKDGGELWWRGIIATIQLYLVADLLLARADIWVIESKTGEKIWDQSEF